MVAVVETAETLALVTDDLSRRTIGLGLQQRPEEVVQVVDVLTVVTQLRRQLDGLAVVLILLVIVGTDVLRFDGLLLTIHLAALAGIVDIDPVRVALVGGERRTHAHPIVTLSVADHVAQAVVGHTLHRVPKETVLAGLLFGAVFMATDPVTSARTECGKWIYGILIGFMVIVVRVLNPGYPEGMMLAILLGNLMAPLIDWCVVRVNINKRKARNTKIKN